eukprot:TRINITY_DN35831_c0_g2_i12.p4 TRINITY_DN35831_c0_g2~~TRINITY_DN35831_c0_g2_i12.p4  ORF type:complete len:101 (+),score=20.90 TRINITY_DN35831_c0_g2_i12:1591-1893(+)
MSTNVVKNVDDVFEVLHGRLQAEDVLLQAVPGKRSLLLVRESVGGYSPRQCPALQQLHVECVERRQQGDRTPVTWLVRVTSLLRQQGDGGVLPVSRYSSV